MLRMFPVTFEKDDDSNGHIDFITAASVSCLCRDLGCDIRESIDYVCRDGTDTQYNYDNAKISLGLCLCCSFRHLYVYPFEAISESTLQRLL